MPRYVLEGTGDTVGCFQRKTTLLTGVEKSGINWPGAREYGYMASSPSYRGRCCISQCYQSYVSCSCKVCSTVLPLVCQSTEGERRCSRRSEQESHHPSTSLTYIHTFRHRNALLQFLIAIADAWFLQGRRGKWDLVTASQKCVWLLQHFVCTTQQCPLRSESCAHLRCTRTNTDRRKRLCVAGQWFFSPPHNHFKHHVICGTEVHLLRCRTAEL